MTIFAIRFRKGQVHLQLGVRETEEVKKGEQLPELTAIWPGTYR